MRSRRAAVRTDLTMYACVLCISARWVLRTARASSARASRSGSARFRRAFQTSMLVGGRARGAGEGGAGEREDEVLADGVREGGLRVRRAAAVAAAEEDGIARAPSATPSS